MTDVLRFEEPLRRYRFLLSDGRVLDVDSCRDDSNLRGWLLEQVGGKSEVAIVGSTVLPEQGSLNV